MKTAFCLAVSLLLGFAVAVRGDDPPASEAASPPKEELSPEAQAAADELQSSLPKDSEARAMLEDILQGSQLGPKDGWFRLAVSQTRFDWDSTRGTAESAAKNFPEPHRTSSASIGIKTAS